MGNYRLRSELFGSQTLLRASAKSDDGLAELGAAALGRPVTGLQPVMAELFERLDSADFDKNLETCPVLPRRQRNLRGRCGRLHHPSSSAS